MVKLLRLILGSTIITGATAAITAFSIYDGNDFLFEPSLKLAYFVTKPITKIEQFDFKRAKGSMASGTFIFDDLAISRPVHKEVSGDVRVKHLWVQFEDNFFPNLLKKLNWSHPLEFAELLKTVPLKFDSIDADGIRGTVHLNAQPDPDDKREFKLKTFGVSNVKMEFHDDRDLVSTRVLSKKKAVTYPILEIQSAKSKSPIRSERLLADLALRSQMEGKFGGNPFKIGGGEIRAQNIPIVHFSRNYLGPPFSSLQSANLDFLVKYSRVHQASRNFPEYSFQASMNLKDLEIAVSDEDHPVAQRTTEVLLAKFLETHSELPLDFEINLSEDEIRLETLGRVVRDQIIRETVNQQKEKAVKFAKEQAGKFLEYLDEKRQK